jgi:hypothetical protein
MEWTVVLTGPARKSLKRIPAGWPGECLEASVQLFLVQGILRLRISFAFAKLILRSG